MFQRLADSFPEEDVVRELLRSSKEFQDFYRSERPKITKPVFWIQDPKLPEGVDNRYSVTDKGQLFIRLRTIPAAREEACAIAHELEHVVLDLKGFPSVRIGDPKFENLSAAINSMIHDLQVNDRLKEFGFDLRREYLEEAAESRRQLTRFSSPPPNKYGRLQWTINYATKILDWEQLETYEKNVFAIWFKSKFPEIAKRGNKLAEMVRNIGYDTKEKQIELFNRIIDKYKLRDVIIPPN